MHIFNATVHQQDDGIVCTSQITVTQKIKNNSLVVVARIDDWADPMDHRRTKIDYADGRLSFSDVYDGPLRKHTVAPFSGSDISLQTFFAGRGEMTTYLCAGNDFYPIRIEKTADDFKIYIYQATPILHKKGLLFPILARVTKTKTHAHGFEYTIQTTQIPSLPLLATIFSLPFTLNLLV